MNKSEKPVIIEQVFNAPKQEVWNAITELNQMKQWFFENIKSFESKIGFETKFVVQNEDRVFPHCWKILEVIPNEKIVYNWKYEGYDGNSFVSFELTEQKENTLLKLTHTVTESFTANVPEFSRENCINGWNYFINERLKAYLKNR